jgi:FkbM family methyltransferase
LLLAQTVCRPMPPLISQKLRSLIYPLHCAYRDDVQFTVRSQTGSLFQSRTGDFHGYPFSVHGYYEWRNWAIALAVCSRGDTIVEIGANIGTETVGFRDIVGESGEVFAFEPLPSNLQILEQVLQLNHCQNVRVIPMALGREKSKVSFILPDKPGASGIGYVASGNCSETSKSIEVDCGTLDGMASTIGTARIIFIDTEGAETAVIDGGMAFLRTEQPYLVLEASPQLLLRAGSNLGELFLRLKALGYETFAISRFGLMEVKEPSIARATNWLCVPRSKTDTVPRVRRFLRVCGLLPCIQGVNPMTKWRWT